MQIPSKHLEAAVEQFSSLPGIGKRSALRLVLQMLKRDPQQIQKFAKAIEDLATEIKFCESCGNIADEKICTICNNPNRDHKMLCVVEDIRDILAIEATGQYGGIYHVLNGIISPMDGIGPEDLNIETLLEKTQSGVVNEIIFALPSTMEGDTTNFYLYKKLAPFDIKVTTLSRGLAVGSELQYADEITLGKSIIQRLPYESSMPS